MNQAPPSNLTIGNAGAFGIFGNACRTAERSRVAQENGGGLRRNSGTTERIRAHAERRMAQRCAEMRRDAQRCAEMRRMAQPTHAGGTAE